jgi:hypothetical protein
MNPNAARIARANEWQWLGLRRTGRRAGIRTRRPRPGRTVRSAGKKLRYLSGRRKDGRCCAGSAFSTGGRSLAPDYFLNFTASGPAGYRSSGAVGLLRLGGGLAPAQLAVRVANEQSFDLAKKVTGAEWLDK